MTDEVTSLFLGVSEAPAAAENHLTIALANMPDDHPFFQGVRNHSYTFMLVNVGGHWISLILHQKQRAYQGTTLTNIDHVMIGDPLDLDDVKRFMWTRLQ